jgi:histidinol-phosphate aminotransferase
MSISLLVRPNIRKLAPYTCARDEFSGEADAWLDANENSRLPGLNRYPDPLQRAVKEEIAQWRGISADHIFLGVGSDECIDLCYRVFCRPGVDNVVAIDPTYGMYSVCAAINDVEYRSVPLRYDFSLDSDALLAATDANTRIIWLCSPNNPTANAFSLDQLEDIASRFHGITVIDEAYVDFSTKGSALTGILQRQPRTIVMQTFSKAWGRAAMRLGMAFADPEIIGYFNKVKYPYNINELTQREALRALRECRSEVKKSVANLLTSREDLAASLRRISDIVLEVFPSDANFLLVKVVDADGLYNYLCENGVVVRNRSRVTLCNGCLRITVGTEAENDLLIKKIKQYVKR